MIDKDFRYKISPDVEFSKFSKNEYLLHNHKLGKYLKINQSYYNLLILANGERTVSEINTIFKKKIKLVISDNQIILLFDNLKQYGVFSCNDYIKENIKIPNYIKFGFIFMNSRIISKIVPFLAFLFKKYIFITIFILSIIIFIFNLYTNFQQYEKLDITIILPYFVILTFISVIFHELGHATATYHFKAKHGGIGFGFFIYFIPVFFADVTDIWRLNRKERIIVNGAGVYFETIFCLILSIIGLLVRNQTIEILALIIAGKALYNLLPFLRADGYWILSDLFNKSNLYYQSFNNLKCIIIYWIKGIDHKFKKVDYLIALYGLFNIFLIVIFFYYQIILNIDSVIRFPLTVIELISSIYNDKLLISFNKLISLSSILIFYIVFIKIIVMLSKKLLQK